MKLIKAELIPYTEFPECPKCSGIMKPLHEYENIEREVEESFLVFFSTKKKEKDFLQKFECLDCKHQEAYDRFYGIGAIAYKIKGKLDTKNED